MNRVWLATCAPLLALALGDTIGACGASSTASDAGADSSGSDATASGGSGSGASSGVTSNSSGSAGSSGAPGSTSGGTSSSGMSSSGASSSGTSSSGASSSGASSSGASSSSSGAGSSSGTGSSSGSGSSGGGKLVWTNRYDVARSGSQTNETQLTPATVSSGKFGKLFSDTVDGTIQAQPLYAQGVMIGGMVHNVVFVGTEHDSVYAFDADAPGAPLWAVSLGPAVAFGSGPNPWACKDLIPEAGVSATPVLDASSGTLYVLAETLENSAYHRKLHALDWTSGEDKVPPAEIAPPDPEWTASPANHCSRVGLPPDQGTDYMAFSSHCDGPSPWYGWVVAHDAKTLMMKGSFKTGQGGGIWQSGQGLVSDGTAVFFVAGTGGGATCNATNLCQTMGRLTFGASGLTLASFYQPAAGSVSNNGADLDLATAFVLAGGNIGMATGKDGTLHVLNRTTMTSMQDVLVSQSMPSGSGTGGGHIHGGPVFWDGAMGPRIYVWPEGPDPLKAYSVTAAGVGTTPVASFSKRLPAHPGAILTISSNGKMPGTGVLWASMVTMDSADAWHALVPGTLYALDAENPSDTNAKAELWNSDTNAGDTLGLFAKFCPPTVANGKLYIGTAVGTDMQGSAQLRVYGLKP